MEETIKEMRERHEREVAELQARCTHPKISDWMEQWWAPGHSTEFQVKACEICGKVVDRRPQEGQGG